MKSLIHTIKQEPFFFLFANSWKYSQGHRHLVVVFLGCFVIANLALLIEPLIFGHVLNIIQAEGLTSNNISYISLLFLSFMALESFFWVFWWTGRYLENKTAFLTEIQYREYLAKGVMNLPIGWHNDHDSGDTLDKINQSGDAVRAFSQNIFEPVRILVRVPGVFVAMLFFGWQVAVVMITILLFAFTVVFLFDKWLAQFYIALNKMQNDIGARTFDILSNIQSIKILHIERGAFQGFSQIMRRPYKETVRTAARQETKWFIGMHLFQLMLVMILLTYIWVQYGLGATIAVGTLSTLYLYSSNLLDVFVTFSYYYGELVVSKTRIQNVSPVVQAIENNQTKKRQDHRVSENLLLDDLSFSYQSENTHIPALVNVDVQVKQGEKIALIGQSGSGKTTFLKVLHGLYEGVEGIIEIDGKKIDKQLHEIDLGTTLVPQEPELFSSSVTENITFGLDYGEEDIRKVTDLAMFTTVAEHLPNGFNSKINEKGVNLSGGQKQRLALARALLFARDKDIILLDESTSSVDPETEVQIYNNIFHHFQGKTFIASIHKMNLLKYFDRIVMFKEGTITDEGTFDHLVQHNQEFREMWESYVETNQ